MTLPLITRLEKQPNGCIHWTGKLDKRGRGRVWVDGKLKLSHRAVREQINGPIPDGKILCHHCDNPTCCNVDHLYVGTHADNMADMSHRRRSFAHKNPERVRNMAAELGHKNTWTRGEGNPKAKLTKEQAESIRADKRPTKVLAEIYGVNRTTIQTIRRGQRWKEPLCIASLRAREGGE